ncbi:MAG: hypothetical protein OXG72_02130 [Acidobacteria bacterium]|nr:hypothetical protein [Acidobacteriota bacterium]
MQEQLAVNNLKGAERGDILSLVPGAASAAARIRDAAARDAFRELLRTAIRLNLRPARIQLGKTTGFAFGPQRYPLCRINAAKGIAFHARRGASALIIRAPGDHAFRLAAGMLRRLALSMALDA